MGFFTNIDASALSTLDCRKLREKLVAEYNTTFKPHTKEGFFYGKKEGLLSPEEYKWLVMNVARNFAVDKFEDNKYTRGIPHFGISVMIGAGVNSLPTYEDFIAMIR